MMRSPAKPEIDVAVANEDFARAIDLLEHEAEKRNLSASELVDLGRWIQLSEHTAGHDLPDALAAFENALLVEPDFPMALVEIGWFHYSVQNDPSTARSYFERSVKRMSSELREAVEGLLNCIRELEGESAVRQHLDELREEVFSATLLDELLPIVESSEE